MGSRGKSSLFQGTALIAAFGSVLAFAQTSAGFHPRPAPSDYAAFQQTKAVTYAASVIPAEQVRRIFSADISSTYVVFEIACYPSSGTAVGLDPSDFAVKTGAGEFVHPADAATVAAVIQEKNAPKPPSARTTDIYTTAGVGYESGTDPYTGRRVHGVYTEAGAGVGSGPNGAPPYPPPPGSTPQDRANLAAQLADKALPEGNITAPIAGFVYFPASSLKKKSSGKYELQYLDNASSAVTLPVPVKSH